MGMPGWQEMMVILFVALLVFGGRLPEVGRSLGRSLIEFRKGLRGLKDEIGLNELEDVRRDLRNVAHDTISKIDTESKVAGNVIDAEGNVIDAETVEHEVTAPSDAPGLDPAAQEPPDHGPPDHEHPGGERAPETQAQHTPQTPIPGALAPGDTPPEALPFAASELEASRPGEGTPPQFGYQR